MNQATSSQCLGCSSRLNKILRTIWLIQITESPMTVQGCVLLSPIKRARVVILIIISNFTTLIGTTTNTRRSHRSLIMLLITIRTSLTDSHTLNMRGRAIISFKIGWQMLCLRMKLGYGMLVSQVCSFLARASLLFLINMKKLRTTFSHY